ncbi:MAG: hypothetical protein QXW70_01575, partial [Candidatus Anstonellales archaeon]
MRYRSILISTLTLLLFLSSLPLSEKNITRLQVYVDGLTVHAQLTKVDMGSSFRVYPEELERQVRSFLSENRQEQRQNEQIPFLVQRTEPLAGQSLDFFLYNRETSEYQPVFGCSGLLTDERGIANCTVSEISGSKTCSVINVSYSGTTAYEPSTTTGIVCDESNNGLSAFGLATENYLRNRQTYICLPIFLILGLLLASLYYSGKNPLNIFDITTPRLPRPKKHRITPIIIRSHLISNMLMNMSLLRRAQLDIINAADAIVRILPSDNTLHSDLLQAYSEIRSARRIPPHIRCAAIAALFSSGPRAAETILRNAYQRGAVRSIQSLKKNETDTYLSSILSRSGLDKETQQTLMRFHKFIQDRSSAAIVTYEKHEKLKETYGYSGSIAKLLLSLSYNSYRLDRTLPRTVDKTVLATVGRVPIVGPPLASVIRSAAKVALLPIRTPLNFAILPLEVVGQTKMAVKSAKSILNIFSGSLDNKRVGNFHDALSQIKNICRHITPETVREEVISYAIRKINEAYFGSSIDEETRNRLLNIVGARLASPLRNGDYDEAYRRALLIMARYNLVDQQTIDSIKAVVRDIDRRYYSYIGNRDNSLDAGIHYLSDVHALIRKFQTSHPQEQVFFLTTRFYDPQNPTTERATAAFHYFLSLQAIQRLRSGIDTRTTFADIYTELHRRESQELEREANSVAQIVAIRYTLSPNAPQRRQTRNPHDEFLHFLLNRIEIKINRMRPAEVYRDFSQVLMENATILRFYQDHILPLLAKTSSGANLSEQELYQELMKHGVDWRTATRLIYTPPSNLTQNSTPESERIGSGIVRGWIVTGDGTFKPLFIEGMYHTFVTTIFGSSSPLLDEGLTRTNSQGQRISVMGASDADKIVSVYSRDNNDLLATHAGGPIRRLFYQIQQPFLAGAKVIFAAKEEFETVFALQALERKAYKDIERNYNLGTYFSQVPTLRQIEEQIASESDKTMRRKLERKRQDMILEILNNRDISRTFKDAYEASLLYDLVFLKNEVANFMRDPRGGSSSYGIRQAIHTGYHTGQSFFEPASYFLTRGYVIGEDYLRSLLWLPERLGRLITYFSRAPMALQSGYPSVYEGTHEPVRPMRGRALMDFFSPWKNLDRLSNIRLPEIHPTRGLTPVGWSYFDEYKRTQALRWLVPGRTLQQRLNIHESYWDNFQNLYGTQEMHNINEIFNNIVGDTTIDLFRNVRQQSRWWHWFFQRGENVTLQLTGYLLATGPESALRTPELYINIYTTNIYKAYPVGMMYVDDDPSKFTTQHHLNARLANRIIRDYNYLVDLYPDIKEDALRNIWRRDKMSAEELESTRKHEYSNYEFRIFSPFFLAKWLAPKTYNQALDSAVLRSIDARTAYYENINLYTSLL